MTARKFQKGRPVLSIADFSRCSCEWFWIAFGSTEKAVHRSFVISWQYRIIEDFIKRRQIFVADAIKKEG